MKPGPPFDASLLKRSIQPGRDDHYWASRFVKGKWRWFRTLQPVKTQHCVLLNDVCVGKMKRGKVVVDDQGVEWASVNKKDWSLVKPSKFLVQ